MNKTTDNYPTKTTALLSHHLGGQFQPESGGQFKMAGGGQFDLAEGGQFAWIFQLMEELQLNGYLQKKEDGSYKFMKDLDAKNNTRTVLIPLIGTVACGIPILAEQNIEAMIPVSTNLVRSGTKYFLLTVKGDSMDKAGINSGDMILIKQQFIADNGDKVVALIDDDATVKEFHRTKDVITLLPRSTNSRHKPIIVSSDFQIQGIVKAVIPKITN